MVAAWRMRAAAGGIGSSRSLRDLGPSSDEPPWRRSDAGSVTMHRRRTIWLRDRSARDVPLPAGNAFGAPVSLPMGRHRSETSPARFRRHDRPLPGTAARRTGTARSSRGCRPLDRRDVPHLPARRAGLSASPVTSESAAAGRNPCKSLTQFVPAGEARCSPPALPVGGRLVLLVHCGTLWAWHRG